jgi:hypothetical protein
VYRLLVGKLEGKRPPERPRLGLIDNIKIDLLEIKLGVVDWIGLSQDRCRWRDLVNAVMKFQIIRFADFTAVNMKNAVFWNVMQCDYCKNQSFGGM